MAAFIVDAEAAMERDDFDAAAAACEEVLVMDPEHAGALACLDRITVILEERRAAAECEARRLRLDALSAAVSADIEEGAFKRALDRLDAFLESEPGTPELDDLRAQAEAAQRELERREAVAAAVTEKVASAVQLLSDSDCQGALACLDAAMTLDPRHPAAAALRLQLLDSLRQLSTVSVSAPAEWVRQERVMPAATESSAPDVDPGDALSLFASEADALRSAASPAASVRHLESGDVTPIVPAVSPVASVRWPGRASRAFLATSALMPVAGGLLAFWYIVRPPVLPVVAAASIDKPAPAPAVALFALTGTAAAPLNSAPTPPASAATTAARAREAANNEAANARAAATRARTQPADVPAAPVADMAADERAVRAALQSYAGAFAALDVDGVRRVFPGTSEAGLRRSFAGIGAQQIEIRDEQMAVAGDAATVSCTWITSTVGADGSAAHTRDSRRLVFNLARRGGSWVIVDRR
jgi:hypothetical protein